MFKVGERQQCGRHLDGLNIHCDNGIDNHDTSADRNGLYDRSGRNGGGACDLWQCGRNRSDLCCAENDSAGHSPHDSPSDRTNDSVFQRCRVHRRRRPDLLMMTTQKKQWNASFSRMRSLACVAIVVLHTCSYAMVAAHAKGTALSDAQVTLTSFGQYSCMWAVPLFVMASGALLLDPERELTWDRLLHRYIARVGGALFVFGLLFIAFDFAMNGVEETAANSLFYVAHPGAGAGYVFLCCLVDLLTGHSWAHMWYLYMLVGLYLLLPFMKKVVAGSAEKDLLVLAGLLFVFTSVIPILGLFGVETDYRFSVATVYPLYFLLGNLLSSQTLKLPKWVALTGFVLATLFVWGYVWCAGGERPEWYGYVTSYNSIPIVAQATCLFSLLCRDDMEAAPDGAPSSEENMQLSERCLLAFDHGTFGIYLIHLVFVKLAFRYAGLDPYASPAWFPLTVIAVVLLSWLVTWALQKLPLFRKIL